jgi:hypothetical protein
LRAGSPALVLAAAALALAACTTRVPKEDQARMALLEHTYDRLHERLGKAASHDPLVASASANRGEVVLAIRSALIEELAGNVARRYLDRVTLDLSEVEGHGSGELRRKTFLGRIKIGDWSVSVELRNLKGRLRAGSPSVTLRGPDRIDVQLPVDVEEAEGDATVRLRWDSAGLANVVCRDFELTRDLRGRVLAQRHLVAGALRLRNDGESLTATPVFADRRIQLKLDLTPRSWGVVEAALRSQDTSGKCGTLMDPEKGLVRLRALAARGIKVRLPDSIFRTVSLPARLQKSVQVSQRDVAVRLTAESLRVETATLWSSVSLEVTRQPVGRPERGRTAPMP